ncbi:hypothetical protein PINS_up008222 [Pythium insidiosum]|nr:hypothetical protein PINS_up008222 [Pythium insidiosum]
MWVQPPQAYFWVLPPCLLYFVEKRYRVRNMFGGRTSILRVELHKDTTAIFLRKPKNFRFLPGMYLYVNIPLISQFEWHPFTISSAPEDEFLSVHIRKAGDWTGALYALMGQIHERHKSNLSVQTTTDTTASQSEHLSPYPSIFIDGPIGAPSQEYFRHRTVVFVGAGIGVTPFASILRSIVHQWEAFRCPCCHTVTIPKAFRLQKIYFYWITREQEALTWFSETMNQLAELDTGNRLEIHNYFSPLKDENVIAPLRALQTFIHDTDGQDIISGLATKQGHALWTPRLEKGARACRAPGVCSPGRRRATVARRRDRRARRGSRAARAGPQRGHWRVLLRSQAHGQRDPRRVHGVQPRQAAPLCDGRV